ncbi:hypothetical protein DSO57_1003895 [Entomophthora muscae]|uniref:Uncharacterized protein n=1 Tax=Entomophthora muscae TaxID=34485 RepID=A0ACC2SAG0_9FUNG|nr:hypothetical protein DSO57_1003895 [Entomophthora muscae]
MPYVVPNAKKSIPTAKKPTQKRIPNIKHIILLELMRELGDYKAAAALVGVDPKYALKTFQKFINTGCVLAAEKSLSVSTMLTKEHKRAIRQWITRECHLELANIGNSTHVNTLLTWPLLTQNSKSPMFFASCASLILF